MGAFQGSCRLKCGQPKIHSGSDCSCDHSCSNDGVGDCCADLEQECSCCSANLPPTPRNGWNDTLTTREFCSASTDRFTWSIPYPTRSWKALQESRNRVVPRSSWRDPRQGCRSSMI